MQKFGIDISKWQGDFPLSAAVQSDGVEFVIIKAGGSDKGVYTDKQFESNYRKAKEIGLPVGCYWFSKAMSVDEAKRDAEYFYNLLQGKQFELPVYIDVENKQQLALGKDKLTEIIITFLSYLEDRKYFAGIYSSRSYFQTYVHDDQLERFTHWIAAWGTQRPSGCAVWQFGGETNKIRSNKIQGMTVDQNYMFVDFPSTMKKAKLNGYGTDTIIRNRLVELKQLGYNYNDIMNVLITLMEE